MCEHCGRQFEPKPTSRVGRFCSLACYHAHGRRGDRKEITKIGRYRLSLGHPLAPPSGLVSVARLALFEKIGPGPHPCHWCGRTLSWMIGRRPPDALMVDHLDWNRHNDAPENLVPSCNSCNARRAAPGKRSAIRDDELAIRRTSGFRTRAIEKPCEGCGKALVTIPSRPRRFCSHACYRRRGK